MVDRQPDLSLSERAVEDIAIRVTGRSLARREMLRAFTALRWLFTLKDGWFYFWSPKQNPYSDTGECRCHRMGIKADESWIHDLLVELEEQFKTTAAELC